MLVLQNTPPGARRRAAAAAGGWRRRVDQELSAAKFDLTLGRDAVEAGSVQGHVEYATDLFERGTVERMVRHYARAARRRRSPRPTRPSPRWR